MKHTLTILFILICSLCAAQSKSDSTISIPPTLEARMIEAEKSATAAKAELQKAEKELNDSMKILFEIAGKKQEEYDITGYSPGVIKIKRKPKK